jgi:hypothetical protein
MTSCACACRASLSIPRYIGSTPAEFAFPTRAALACIVPCGWQRTAANESRRGSSARKRTSCRGGQPPPGCAKSWVTSTMFIRGNGICGCTDPRLPSLPSSPTRSGKALDPSRALIGRTAYNGRAAPEHIGWRQARLVGRQRSNDALCSDVGRSAGKPTPSVHGGCWRATSFLSSRRHCPS